MIKRERRGLTLVEIIVVLVITVIVIVGFGASASTQIKRANREAVMNELQIMSNNLSDAYYDLGSPDFDPTVEGDRARFVSFINIIASEYAGLAFDTTATGIENLDNGWAVSISDPLDIYDNNYKCWFVTKGSSKYVIIASPGPNGSFNSDGYASQRYDDDLVLVVKPKVGG